MTDCIIVKRLRSKSKPRVRENEFYTAIKTHLDIVPYLSSLYSALSIKHSISGISEYRLSLLGVFPVLILTLIKIKICSNFYERFSVLSTIHLFCTLNSIFLRSEMHYDALYVMSNVWLIPQCVCPSTTSAVRQILPTVCKIQFQRKGRKFRLTFSDSYLITVT